MEKKTWYVIDNAGNAIGGVTITVYNTGTLVKPTIYSDNGVTVKANPFTNETDDGSFYFYTANNRVDIVRSHPTFTFDDDDFKDILFNDNQSTMVALGGGAIATLGNTGTPGPSSSAQGGWIRQKQEDGTYKKIPWWPD